MEFSRKITLFVFEVQHRRFDRIRIIVMGDQHENRGCIDGDAESGTELRLVVIVEETASVNEYKEVWPAWIVQVRMLRVGPMAAIP